MSSLHRHFVPLFVASAISVLLPRGALATDETTALRGRVIDAADIPRFSSRRWATVEGIDTARGIVAGDIDGDGRAEVVAESINGDRYIIVSQRAGGETTEIREAPRPRRNAQLVGSGDLDNDGCDDIFAWNREDASLSVGTADSGGGFRWSAPIKIADEQDVLSVLVEGDGVESPRSLILSNTPEGALIRRVRDGHFENDDRVALSGEALDFPIPTGMVLADVNGDGAIDLLTPTSRSRSLNWFVSGTGPRPVPFASLPERLRTPHLVPIDLNGDRRSDFLVWSDTVPILGWFALMSTGVAGIERSVPEPVAAKVDRTTLRTGDFDGDGLADLVGLSRGAGGGATEMWLSVRTEPRGIPGVTVHVEGAGSEVRTGPDGRFVIQIPAGRATICTFAKDGFELAPKRVQAHPGRTHSILVAGENISAEGRPMGAATALLADPPGPYLCLGYRNVGPTAPGFEYDEGYIRGYWQRTSEECPHGYATYDITRVRRDSDRRIKRRFFHTCCRLPAADILTDQHEFVSDRCPADSIVTGGRTRTVGASQHFEARCTKINTERYQLGGEHDAIFWGYALSMRREAHRLPLVRYPVALRYGISRSSWRSFDTSGCGGGPEASLLVGIQGEACGEHRVRQLEYRGAPGDPAQGTAVKMFPECSVIDNLYDPLTGCR